MNGEQIGSCLESPPFPHPNGEGVAPKPTGRRDPCGDGSALYLDGGMSINILVMILYDSLAQCYQWGDWVQCTGSLCIVSYICM